VDSPAPQPYRRQEGDKSVTPTTGPPPKEGGPVWVLIVGATTPLESLGREERKLHTTRNRIIEATTD